MRLEARNETLAHVFEDLARQLVSSFIDPKDIGETLREKIAVEGESLEELLREWVNTCLSLLKARQMIFRTFRITEITTTPGQPYALRAEVLGELFDPQRHAWIQNPNKIHRIEAQLHRHNQEYISKIIIVESF